MDDAMEVLRVCALAFNADVPAKDLESVRVVIQSALERLAPVREFIEEGPAPN